MNTPRKYVKVVRGTRTSSPTVFIEIPDISGSRILEEIMLLIEQYLLNNRPRLERSNSINSTIIAFPFWNTSCLDEFCDIAESIIRKAQPYTLDIVTTPDGKESVVFSPKIDFTLLMLKKLSGKTQPLVEYIEKNGGWDNIEIIAPTLKENSENEVPSSVQTALSDYESFLAQFLIGAERNKAHAVTTTISEH